MIRKILEYLDNKKELEEMQKEYSQMKKVLTFNLEKESKLFESIDKLIKQVIITIDSNEYNGIYDKNAKLRKINELILDFEKEINSYK